MPVAVSSEKEEDSGRAEEEEAEDEAEEEEQTAMQLAEKRKISRGGRECGIKESGEGERETSAR